MWRHEVQKVGRAVRAGRDGQRTLPDEPRDPGVRLGFCDSPCLVGPVLSDGPIRRGGRLGPPQR